MLQPYSLNRSAEDDEEKMDFEDNLFEVHSNSKPRSAPSNPASAMRRTGEFFSSIPRQFKRLSGVTTEIRLGDVKEAPRLISTRFIFYLLNIFSRPFFITNGNKMNFLDVQV